MATLSLVEEGLPVVTYLPLAERNADIEESIGIHTAFRTRWIFEFEVARLPAGGAITLEIESAPVNDDDYYTSVVTSGSITAPGNTRVRGFGDNLDFSLTTREQWIRAKVNTKTSGSFVWAVRGAASFLDVQITGEGIVGKDADFFSSELARFQDGQRIVREAERDVVDTLIPQHERVRGRLEAFTEADTFLPVMKVEIVQQAEHLFQRELLRRSKDPSARVSLRQMGRYHPLFGGRLHDFRAKASGSGAGGLYRGRG